MTGLTGDQAATLQVLVTAPAWAAHEALGSGEKVDLAQALLVHGDLKLVAADVLDNLAYRASLTAAQSSGGTKRVKIEGELEIEKFAKTSADSVTASAWTALAARYRREVGQAGRSGLVRSPIAGIRTGNTGPPVFMVTRPCKTGEP